MALPNTQAVFTVLPNIGIGALTVANTLRDGTGTIVSCFSAGSNGSRAEFITIAASGTATTSGLVNLFLSSDSGATWRFWSALAVTAATPSATVDSFRGEINRVDGLPTLVLPNNTWRIGAAPTKAENFNVIVSGGDF